MTQGTRDLLVLVYTLLLWVSLQGLNLSENVHTDKKKKKREGGNEPGNEHSLPHQVLNRDRQDTSTAQKAFF